MLRFRRYRVFLVFAVIATIAVYHFSSVRQWGSPPSISVDTLKNFGLKGTSGTKSTIADVGAQTLLASLDTSVVSSIQTSPTRVTSKPEQTWRSRTSLGFTSTSHVDAGTVSDLEGTVPKGTPVPSKQGKPFDPAPPSDANLISEHGQGRNEVVPDHNNSTITHWRMLVEHFPVPAESIIPLPTGVPKRIPKIQHVFTDESTNSRIDRERKLVLIREAFSRSWKNYRQYAWLQDELKPVSGGFRNPFCGWAATLVDSLDALWILGMKDDFEEAANAVKEIDFTTSIRSDIPLFETTIRYLGGLIAAYDLSEGRYKVLLDKSIELAEILMGAFDTPNRMPVVYYHWKPAFASQPHRAATKVILAELGSLSLEFTRLAQITKDNKYYDAIARITNELEIWQNHTNLPGMWPVSVDASGCKKSDVQYGTPIKHSTLKGPQDSPWPIPQMIVASASTSSELTSTTSISKTRRLINKKQLQDEAPGNGIDPPSPSNKRLPGESDLECRPQGLASPPQQSTETFTLGGMSDSVYEYLPKEYMLLGGLNEQYRNMFQRSLQVVKEHLLFRPMVPNDRNVLIAGSITYKGNSELADNLQLVAEGQHLTCFAGGMFAIGGRIFDRQEDLEIAAKLTDGCIWAYESTATGIMPEGFIVVPCPSKDNCPWNETLYMEALDPYKESRDMQREQQEQSLLAHKDKVDGVRSTMSSKLPATTKEPKPSHALGHSKGKRQIEDSDVAFDAAGGSAPQLPGKHSDTGHSDEQVLDTKNHLGTDTITFTAEPENFPTLEPAYTPPPILSHKEFVTARIKSERLPKGFTRIWSTKYILRPEAIESVFIMYRTTGDEYWREKGWQMFTAIQNYTRVEYGNSAIDDVTNPAPNTVDQMESFWLAETLKYFYLLFSDPEVVSLDDYVLNTEAHPFKRPK